MTSLRYIYVSLALIISTSLSAINCCENNEVNKELLTQFYSINSDETIKESETDGSDIEFNIVLENNFEVPTTIFTEFLTINTTTAEGPTANIKKLTLDNGKEISGDLLEKFLSINSEENYTESSK